MTEAILLSAEERWGFDRALIDEVAFPVGDRYPEEIFSNYFFWYSGLVKKYKPHRILEIGVRYGYTGIVFCLAAKAGRPNAKVEYIGLDDESYHHESCAKANENFAQMMPKGCDAKAIKHNSFTGIPSEFGTFDLIHVDGNHDDFGVLNDLRHSWPILNPGGIIVLDDYLMDGVRSGITQWLEGMVMESLTTQVVNNERGMFLIRKDDIVEGFNV